MPALGTQSVARSCLAADQGTVLPGAKRASVPSPGHDQADPEKTGRQLTCQIAGNQAPVRG